MEAKNTILTQREFGKAERSGKWADDYNPILEAQAEKTWFEAHKDMDIQLVSLAELCLNHRKQGIKEAVEWLREFAIHGGKTSLDEVLDIMAVHSPFMPKQENK